MASSWLAPLIWALAARGSYAQGGLSVFQAEGPPPYLPTTAPCAAAMLGMLNNDDWKFLNNTVTRWCRIRLENKMSTCCQNAEFAKGKADSCTSDCVTDCVHVQMQSFCNTNFGKACVIERAPFMLNNVTDLKVREIFCVPTDCDNTQDLKNNLLVLWYDYYGMRPKRPYWQFDYSSADDIECPTMTVIIIVSLLAAIIVITVSIPISLYLFKAPKERGRVLAGATEEEEEDDAVEPLPAIGGGDTMGSGFQSN